MHSTNCEYERWKCRDADADQINHQTPSDDQCGRQRPIENFRFFSSIWFYFVLVRGQLNSPAAMHRLVDSCMRVRAIDRNLWPLRSESQDPIKLDNE